MIKLKRTLITGITGQDGAYLAALLISKGYEVFGTYRRSSTPNFWRLQYLQIAEKVKLIPFDLLDSGSMLEALHISNPDEVYHLAAQSFVGASFDQPIATAQVTGLGTTRLLEGIRRINRDAKVYQASTSELYGNSSKEAKDEESILMPRSPYAAAKLYAYWIANIYRDAYGLFVSNGILFNHESPIRGLEFVTRKVTNAVARIKLGLQSKLRLGNLDSCRDWGYAPEYVEAMWKILQADEPSNFVVATNESHSVRELVNLAFELAGLNRDDHVEISKSLIRPLEVDDLKGSHNKATEILGWKPKVKFRDLIKIMYDEDLKRWKGYLDGKVFPWDALTHPDGLMVSERSYKLDK